MAYLYKEYKDSNNQREAIKRLSDSAFIPLDPDNRDYKEFLELSASQGEANILEPAS